MRHCKVELHNIEILAKEFDSRFDSRLNSIIRIQYYKQEMTVYLIQRYSFNYNCFSSVDIY